MTTGSKPALDLHGTGYLHDRYADSLAFAGTPVRLKCSGGVLVERTIPGTQHEDGMGSYPIFCCRDWSKLGQDLDRLGSRLVSVTLVTDPFGNYHADDLRSWFPDVCRPFKEHAVVDLGREPGSFVSSHHRRNVKKALRQVEVEVCGRPLDHLDEWVRLYGCLIARHEIRGVAEFSATSFRQQLQADGLVMLRAVSAGETVGMILWFLHGGVGYYHLAAYTERGYQARASFALFWRSLDHLASRVRWLSLGANAGTRESLDGLSRFKAGWATGTRMAWLCGRIMNTKVYQALAVRPPAPGAREEAGFFPAYRNVDR